MFKKQRIFLVPVVALALTVLFAVFAFATTSVTSLKISKPTSAGKKVYLTTSGGLVIPLQATAMPTNATTKTAIFTSSDPTVVYIATDWTATCQAIALKAGTADITATSTDGSSVSSNALTLSVYQPVWTANAYGSPTAGAAGAVSGSAIVLKLGDDFKNYLGLDVEPMDPSNPLTKTLVTGAKYSFKDTEGVIAVDKITSDSDMSQLSVKAKKAPKDPTKPVTLKVTITSDGKKTTTTSIDFYVTVPMKKLAIDTKIIPKKMYVGTTYGAITLKSGLKMTPKVVSTSESFFDVTSSDPTIIAVDNSASTSTGSSVKLIPLKSGGPVTITVTDHTNSEITATEDVTVLQPVTGCSVTTQGGVGVAVGSSTTMDLEPQPWDSTNKKTLITGAKYTFKDKEGVLKVDKIDDSTDLTKLVVTAKKAPKDPTKPVTLTITITSDGQKKKITTTASVNFMVKVPPTKIKLAGKDSKTTFPKIAFYNKPTTISAITTPLKVSSSDGYVTYTWNSTDNTVATVVPGTTTGTAILTVLKDGSADITCTANWMTDSAQTLASNAYTVTGYVTTAAIKITDTGAPTATSSAISLSGTGSASLSAALLSAGGASGPTPSATDIKWTSSNAAVASVDASGTSVSVTGKKAGSATITAVVKESSKAGIKTPAKATWTVTVTK